MTAIRIKLGFEESDMCGFSGSRQKYLAGKDYGIAKAQGRNEKSSSGDHTETGEAGIHTLMKGLMNFPVY